MNVATKICRVCGKKYTACRSAKRDDAVFRWREVACSPECGAEYLRLIIDSRQEATHVDDIFAHGDGEEYEEELEDDFGDEALEREPEDESDTE